MSVRKNIHTLAEEIKRKNKELKDLLDAPSLKRFKPTFEEVTDTQPYFIDDPWLLCRHDNFYEFSGAVFCESCGIKFEEHTDGGV